MKSDPENLQDLIARLPALAREGREQTQRFFRKLARRPPRDLDDRMARLHEEAFSRIDCLDCANCCKTTSPIFRDIDIDRIARHLGMRPAALIEQHLHLDDEGDYVLNQAPCPFLGDDNYCSIYEARPRACREYPHTDRKNFHQILGLTQKNMAICPAAYRIVQELMRP